MIHYDPHDWWSHFFVIKGSMVREIFGRVAGVVAWSAAVVMFYEFGNPIIAIPVTIHSLVGLALGLLLVFRTNASYDRFWEGRKAWGGIINETRNLARAATVNLQGAPALRDEAIRWTIAWAFAAKESLREGRDLGPVASSLPPAKVGAVLSADHVPLAVAGQITSTLAEARDQGLISDYIYMQIDQNVQLLIDDLGVCERIHKTPLPFAYVVHVRRALILYCFALPFALVEEFGWSTILETLAIAYIFFGIEEIGVEIADPFGHDDNDLPLDALYATVDRNLTDVISTANRTADAVPS